MKKTVKLLSLFLSMVIVFSASVITPGADAASARSASVEDLGGARIMRTINSVKRVGKVLKFFYGDDIPQIEFSEGVITELCDYIASNSTIDILNLVGNVPVKAALLEKCYTVTNADTTAIRNEIYRMRDEAEAQGDSAKSLLFFFLGAYLSVIEKVDVFTVPFGDDGSSKVGITATFMDGSDETIITDIIFSPDGFVYGPDGRGLQLLGFECSVYDLVIYASVNCWMRDFGFCLFYDIFCYTTPFFNYNTRRYKFDYDGREWMVQVWKGNYLVSNGAEVGIYNRDEGSFGSYYSCYDALMPMGLKLTHGDETIIDIEREHWWINGFKLSDDLYAPKNMTAEFYIDMPDEGMALAFAQAVNDNYRNDSSCTVEGTRVNVVW